MHCLACLLEHNVELLPRIAVHILLCSSHYATMPRKDAIRRLADLICKHLQAPRHSHLHASTNAAVGACEHVCTEGFRAPTG